MKKFLALALFLALCLPVAGCGSAQAAATTTDSATTTAAETTQAKTTAPAVEEKLAGMVWYSFGDTFITAVRNTIDQVASGTNIKIDAADSQVDIATQTNNFNTLMTKGVDYICVNNINPPGSAEMIAQAKAKNIPILFVNCTSPTEEELASYDKAYHVSSAAEQSGWIQGELAAKYWEEHPESDRNGNGKLDYIMLVGMQGNYDSQMRTEKSIEKVNELGIETNCVQEMLCNWQRAEAMNQVASVMAAKGNDIEFIFANNDDMALGAIEALKAAGYQTDPDKYIPVLGVDATKVGVDAIKEGTLLGTSLNNPVTLGTTVFKIIELIDQGKEVTSDSVGQTVSGKHIWLDYVAITADNTDDASY